MKQNIFAIAALAVTVAFTSCSKDNGGEYTGENVNVSLRLEKPAVSGKADEAAVGTPVVSFTSGTLYLTTSSGQIRRTHTLSTAINGDLGVNGSNLNITAMESGTSLTNVAGDVANVYIVANTPTLPASPSMISEVLAVTAAPGSQYNAAGGIGNVTLYGKGDLTTVATNEKEGSICVFPICARIELAGVTGGGDITGFNLNGIFVNNYYNAMVLNADVASASNVVTNNGQGGATIYGDNTTQYPTASVWLKDWAIAGLGGATLAKTPANGAWAYNVLVPGTFNNTAKTTAGTGVVPHLIISLSGIAPASLNLAGTKFLTVGKWYDQSDVEITSFKPGCVYTISASDFVFDEKDPGDEAETAKASVKVTVTPFTWTTQAIKPGF